MDVKYHDRTDGLVSNQACPSIVVSSRIRGVHYMKIFFELPSSDWNVIKVCMSSVPMTTLLLAILRVLAVTVGVAEVGASL